MSRALGQNQSKVVRCRVECLTKPSYMSDTEARKCQVGKVLLACGDYATTTGSAHTGRGDRGSGCARLQRLKYVWWEFYT